MKKSFLSAFVAVAVLFATSCAKDATETVIAPEGDASVSFTVNTPALGSRAYGDGKTAKELIVLVYDKNGYRNDLSLVGDKALQMRDDLTQEAKIEKLVKGEKYSFLFWASANGATELVAANAAAVNDKLFALTVADGNVKVNYNVGKSNNENFDAFFAARAEKRIDNAVNETITLKRPFAQIRVGVNDKAAAIAQFGTDCFANAMSFISIDKYDVFCLRDGKVDETSRNHSSINSAAIPTGTFEVAGKTYDYMLMDYILVSADKEVLTSTTTIYVKDITGAAGSKKIEVRNVPVQRNYRTNIIGSLFTTEANFNVVIDPILYDFDAVITDGGNLTALERLAQNVKISGNINDRVMISSDNAKIEQTITLDNATITNPNSDDPQTFYIGNNVNTTFKGTGTLNACTAPTKNTSVIDTESRSAVVTIDGNITVDGGSGSATNNCVYVNTGKVVIKNGTFKTGLDVNGKQNSCVLVNRGTVEIYGGYFINATSDASANDTTKVGVLNIQDGTASTILCYGGKFVGQDPAKGDNSGTPSTFLAPGYKSVKLAEQVNGKDVYEVVKE